MMRNKIQPFTFHCHTTFSDGKSSVEEMVAGARNIGFTHLGIADHLMAFTVADLEEKIPAYRAHMEHIRAAGKEAGLRVYAGLEVDYVPQPAWEKAFCRFKKEVAPDYTITGNHFLISEQGQVDFLFSYPWNDVPESERNRRISEHFNTIARAVRSGLFDFLAHPDFIRWPSPCGEYDFMEERLDIVNALAETGLPVEINTKGYSKINDFYPARWMLEEIAKRKIPMLISDDAHEASSLGIHFKEAEQRLKETGNTNRIDLADRLA